MENSKLATLWLVVLCYALCFLQGRSQMIATYALLGFSNLAGIGMQIAFIGNLAPEKRHVVSEVVIRALVGGTVACWMTACVAGDCL